MRIALALLVACSSESRPAPPAPRPPVVVAAQAAAPIDAPIDAPVVATVDVFVDLRMRGFDRAAEVIEQRVAQQKPKLKLTAAQGRAAATALVELDRPAVRELHAVMPRSTVELARAVRERGVSVDEAEAIARYLLRVVQALSFERLGTFDENHSHVIGRDWPDIDYTGEGMTWQSQRADWEPKGVISFKRAAFIHAYFAGAERLPHWKRVYRPRGRMRDVQAP
jgi:hypothetical protein